MNKLKYTSLFVKVGEYSDAVSDMCICTEWREYYLKYFNINEYT